MSDTRKEIAGLLNALGGVANSVVADTEAVVFQRLATGQEASHLFPVITHSWSAGTALNIMSALTNGSYKNLFFKLLFVAPTALAQYAVYGFEGQPFQAATAFTTAISLNYVLTTLEQAYKFNELLKIKAGLKNAEKYNGNINVTITPVTQDETSSAVAEQKQNVTLDPEDQEAYKTIKIGMGLIATEMAISTAKAGSIATTLMIGGPGHILTLKDQAVPLENEIPSYLASATSGALGFFTGVKHAVRAVRHVKGLYNIAFSEKEEEQPLLINDGAKRKIQGK